MTANYTETTKLVREITSITCDVCNETFDDVLDLQEFWSFTDTGGYGNMAFGDGVRFELDMCQHCAKKLLGQYIRLTDLAGPG